MTMSQLNEIPFQMNSSLFVAPNEQMVDSNESLPKSSASSEALQQELFAVFGNLPRPAIKSQEILPTITIHKKKAIKKKNLRQSIKEVKQIYRESMIQVYRENRYYLLAQYFEDHPDQSTYITPSQKQLRQNKVAKLKKYRKISIKKLNKVPSTPIWYFDTYNRNLNPSPLSTRSNSVEEKSIDYSFKDQMDVDILSGLQLMLDMSLYNFASDCTMSELMSTLNDIKPINLMNLISMALNSTDYSTIVSCIIAGLELYGYFWKVGENDYMIYILMLAYMAKYIVNNIKSEDPKDQSFVPKKEESQIRTWLKEKLNLDLTTIPSSVMPFLAGICGIIALLTGGKFTNWADLSFKKITKRFKEFTSLAITLNKGTEAIPKLFCSVMSTIAGVFGYDWESEDDGRVKEFKEKLLAFKIEVTTLSDMIQIEPTMLLRDPQRVESCLTAMSELDKLYEELIRQKYSTANVKPIFDDIKKGVDRLHHWAKARKNLTTTKIEPTFVQFSGNSGIGKSQLINYIVDRLRKETGRDLTTWVRNPQEKWWAGYCGQDIVVYDEFNQQKTDEDHSDIMSVKNPNKCQVQMAIAQEKGQQFVSHFIIANSNNLDIQNSAIVKANIALNRRRDVLIEVVDPNLEQFKQTHGCMPGSYEDPVTGEIGNPTFTYKVAGEDVTVKYFSPNFKHLQFFDVPPLPDCRTSDAPQITLDRLVSKIMANYRKYIKQFEASLINSKLYVPTVDTTLTFASDLPSDINPFEGPSSESSSSTDSLTSDDSYDRIMAQNGVDWTTALRMLTDDSKKSKVSTPPNTEAVVAQIKKISKKGKDKFATAFLKRNHMYDEFDEFSDQSAESTATSFISPHGLKGKIFACYGTPGTGKSRIFDCLMDTFGNKIKRIHANELASTTIDTPMLIIDDISISSLAWKLACPLIAQIYDGQSQVKVCYINFNRELAKTYCSDEEEWRLFARRLTAYKFSFKIKKENFFSKHEMFEASDLENGTAPFSRVVNIYDHSINENIDYTVLVQKLLEPPQELTKVSMAICVKPPYMNIKDIKADFIVKTTLPLELFCKNLYNDPTAIPKLILTNQVTFEKGSLVQGYNVASQFSTPCGERPIWPGTLEQFVCMINNSQFTSESPFCVVMIGADRSIVITPKENNPKLIRCFLVSETLTVTDDGFIEDENGKFKMNAATKVEYSEYLTFVKEFGKTEDRAAAVQEQVTENIGLLNIFKRVPFVEKISRIMAYLLRLFLAGASISTLVKHHFLFNVMKTMLKKTHITKPDNDKFIPLYYITDERRKPKVNSFIYDDFRKDADLYGNQTAKQTKVSKLLRDAYDHYGSLDYSHDDFIDFCRHYGEESRDVSQAQQNLPQVNPLLDPLLMESRDVTQAQQNLPQVNPLLDPLLVPESKSVFTDEAALDIQTRNIMSVASSNTVEICSSQGVDCDHLVYGLMVRDKIGVTVCHFYSESERYFVRCKVNGQIKSYPMIVKVCSQASDILIFEIADKTCPNYKNIVHHFPTNTTNISQIARNHVGILCTSEVDRKTLDTSKIIRNIEFEDIQQIYSDLMRTEKTGLRYHGIITGLRTTGLIQTQNGDCGSSAILCNPQTSTKILGIHNAANTEHGFCSLIFQEYFKNIQSIYKNKDECNIQMKVQNFTHTCVTLNEHPTEEVCGMKIIGSGSARINLPTKTKFWTSPTKLPGPSPVQPAILSQFDTRNPKQLHPYYESVKKWAAPQPNVDLDLLDRAVEDIADWYATTCYIEGQHCQILSKTTALNAGIEHGLQQLNRKSSPGYGWNIFFGKKQGFLEMHETKNNIFWAINRKLEPGMKLEIAIDQLINACNTPNLIKPVVVFAGHIKDEPVKLSKIEAVESRSFAGAPFDYVVAMRQYFGAAVGAVHNCRHILPSKIGINPTSLEWHDMTTKMLEVSDIGFDADYKNFDATLLKEIQYRLPRIWNRIYELCDPNWKPEHNYIRQNLHNALYQPLLAIPLEGKTHIVEASGGQVSGQPLTADGNCLANLVNLYCCWLETFKNSGLDNIASFKYYTNAIIYGDDVCVAVHPDVIERFNCQVFVDFMKTWNITVTDAAKTGKITPWIPVTKFEFLKRGFVKKGKYWFGPLHEKSFAKMLNFTLGPAHHWDIDQDKFSMNKNILEATMDSCMQEAIFHGREFYNTMKAHLLKCCAKFKIQWSPQTYESMVRFKCVPLPLF